MTTVDKLAGRKTLKVTPILEEIETEGLKRSIDIVALFESFGVKLEKKGSSYMGRCPFHDDRNPSLSVNREKGVYNCFGCGEGGDAIELVRKIKGLGFRDALSYLKGEYRTLAPVPVPAAQPRPSPAPIEEPQVSASPSSEEGNPQPFLLDVVAQRYAHALVESKEAKDYLERRAIPPAVATRFGLGFSQGTLAATVGQEDHGELIRRGVLLDGGREHLSGCITVPLADGNGEVVGFYGRKIDGGQPAHLYLKGRHQGLMNGKAAKAYSDGLILTESVIDALSLVALGFENVIPCYGSGGFTESHRQALAEGMVRKVLVAFDADEAGKKGADILCGKLRDAGIAAAAAFPPTGKDWNDYLVAKGDPDALRTLLEKALAGATTGEAAQDGPTVTKEGKKYTFTFQEIVYRVVLANESFGSTLRANLRAEASGELFLDNCDLYSSRSRGSFATGLSRLSGFEAVRIERDLLSIVERLEKDREKALDEAAPRSEVVVPQGIEREDAIRFLSSPDLFAQIEQDMDALGYVGERVNKLVVYLTGVSRLLPRPLSIYIQAGSSSGKSYLIETVRRLLPPESVLAISSFSDQALNYMKKEDFTGKVMLLGEAIHNELVEGQIRQMQSEGELSRLVVIKDPKSGELESRQVRNSVRLAFMMSSTALYLNPENASRCLVLHTDESREQTQRILELQRQRRTFEGYSIQQSEVPRLVEKHRAAHRVLSSVPVFNPLSPFLSFPVSRPTMRRTQEQFLTLLEAVALARQYQKPRVMHKNPYSLEATQGIEVDLEDYRIAHTLFREAVLVPNANELPSGARLLYEALRAMAKKRAAEDGLGLTDISFIQRDARELTDLGSESIKKYLRALVDFEYLELVSGRRHGTRFSYRFRDDFSQDPAETYLPSIEELSSLMESQKKTG